MSLSARTRLGAYEILTLIGSGGMGEVYRATDSKLGRNVALKILPATFTNDPERLARFRREAQVLAALNHPHIGAIYGLDEANGTQFLVLELIDGESLDKRIARGPIPVEEAVAIAKQIVEALEAAHEKGIIHRDLKPANIAVTRDGNVKVLDFGLAKPTDPSSGQSFDVTGSPTITSPALMTDVGTLLGTAAYMSPDQARGQVVDKRTDIWAFGCVLYEMLTGRVAFPGATTSDHIAAILEREPDWTALPSATPRSVQRLLRRCLEKASKRRLHDIADARIELEDSTAAASTEPTVSAKQQTRERWWIGAAMTTTLALAGFAAWVILRPAPAVETVRFTIGPPEGQLFASTAGLLSVSPDGRRIAFLTGGGIPEKRVLNVRAIGSLTSQTLPGTERATTSFWSPDSRFIAFITDDGVLKKIAIAGGPAITLAADAFSRGAWSSQSIIVYPGIGNRLYRVSANGGQPTAMTHLETSRGEVIHHSPVFLPDGRRFIYLAVATDPAKTALYLTSIDSPGQRMRLIDVASNVEYAPGYLLYCRNRTLLAHRFDEKNGRLSGDPVTILEGVDYDAVNQVSAFSTSRNGVLGYRTGAGNPDWNVLTWVDRTGRVLGNVGDLGMNRYPRISPDGRRLVFVRGDDRANFNLWQIDLERNVPARFTFVTDQDFWPIVWSPDGRYVVFASSRTNKATWDLYRRPTRGAAEDELLYESPRFKHPSGFSPDGKLLLFTEYSDSGNGWDVWALPLEGDRKPFPVIRTPFSESSAVFSPDGHWIAYVSDDSGSNQVYVQPFPPTGASERLSTTTGWSPIWLADGREIVYATTEQHFMAVSVSGSRETFHAERPRELFAHRYIRGQFNSNFSVDPSGQRFLLTEPPLQRFETPIGVVLNWPSMLPRF